VLLFVKRQKILLQTKVKVQIEKRILRNLMKHFIKMDRIRNKELMLVITLGITIFTLLLFHGGRGPILGNLDIAMFRVINREMQNPILNNLAAMASHIGTKDIYILMLSIFIILIVSMVRHKKEMRKLGMSLLIALLVSVMIVYPLKASFGISRPYFYLSDTHVYCNGEWHNIEESLSHGDKRNSFPSGHASRVFAVLGVFWMYKRLRIPLFMFFFMMSFFIVYVGSHYVSDIIMGSTIGFMVGYLVQENMIL